MLPVTLSIPGRIIDDRDAIDDQEGVVIKILAEGIGDRAAALVEDVAAVAPGGVITPGGIDVVAAGVGRGAPAGHRLDRGQRDRIGRIRPVVAVAHQTFVQARRGIARQAAFMAIVPLVRKVLPV